ncbi:MAG: ECF-type sigma factor [Lysobacterales bacterium]
MNTQTPMDVPGLLERWGEGDDAARDALIPLVYDRLKVLARGSRASVGRFDTLQTTALVNEAFLKLNSGFVDVESHGHFYALVARVMRQVLVDHARRSSRERRGGGWVRVTMSVSDIATNDPDIDMLALDQALEGLSQVSPRAVSVLELTYFAGLSAQKVAAGLGVSSRTIERDLRFGRAWLRDQLAMEMSDP